MKKSDLQQEVIEAHKEIDILKGHLDAAHEELNRTNADLMQLTIELDDRVAERTAVLQQAMDALRESEKKAQALLNVAQDTVIIMDTAGKIEAVNEIGAQRLGKGPKELVGLCAYDLVPQDVAEARKAMLDEVVRTGETSRFIDEREGMVLENYISPIFDDRGRVDRLAIYARDITELKLAEDELRKRTYDLGERVKELECLFGVLDILQTPGVSLEETIKEVVEIIPPGWQYPEITCARITYQDREFKTENFQETEWKLVEDIRVYDERVGSIEVFYLKEMPEFEEGPFLKEERTLVNAIAARLGRAIEHRQTEEALRESEERYRLLFNSVEDALLVHQPSPDGTPGRFVEVNSVACERYGYSREEFLGLSPLDINVAEDEKRLRDYLKTTLDQGHVLLETVHAKKDGTEMPVEISASVFQLGERATVLSVVRDITERKRAEEALRESEERFRHAFDNANTGMALVGLDGRHIKVNEALCEMVGYSKEEMEGMSVQDTTHPGDIHISREFVEEAVAGKIDAGTFEKRHLHKDGSVVWTLVSSSIVRDPRGEPLYFISQVQDITDRKRTEEELTRYREHLEDLVDERTAELYAVNKELEAFAYSVSHDLRAPLRGIDGFSQALLEDYYDQLDEEGRDYLKRVREATKRMGLLIDDILRLSRLTRAEMKRREVDFSSAAREILEGLKENEPEREVELVVEGGLKAEGDERLLRVVLENLLENAWKFTGNTEGARIEFGSTEKHGKAAYFVRDNGVGFDMAYADKLFGAFQRLHPAAEFPGTGIGLATVQRIIHRHGGRIWVDAREGEGATFFFTL